MDPIFSSCFKKLLRECKAMMHGMYLAQCLPYVNHSINVTYLFENGDLLGPKNSERRSETHVLNCAWQPFGSSITTWDLLDEHPHVDMTPPVIFMHIKDKKPWTHSCDRMS